MCMYVCTIFYKGGSRGLGDAPLSRPARPGAN